ncbi:MAG TPA: L,D-transpeptidase family protein [Vicinamibacteria bacterium]|nr:L,D-transpeptidase family protein [Vicinamibacteria bacterium]
MPAARDPKAAETWSAVRRLYETTGGHPLWLVDGRPRPEIAVLRDSIRRAAEDGLNPSDYDLRAADTLQSSSGRGLFKKGGDLEPLMDADVRLSYTFLKFASHLERGRVPPGQVDAHWFGTQRDEDLVQALKVALESGRLAESLEKLESQHAQYGALKTVLARYREVAAAGGWSALPAGWTPRAGRPDPKVAVLRAHLIATGDLPQAAATPAAPVFDAATRDALKHFERRHGLVPDGRLDREVRAALNVPIEERIRQVELNLERWRWLPDTLGDRYVLVNIPTFHLTAVDHGQVALQMRVVTGKADSPTPIFSDEMTTVVFSPYWNVPPDIARNETIPAVMRDPGYLGRNDLEVVRAGRVLDPGGVDWSRPGKIQFRQRPGAHNALGGVKFMFPNQFDVYLHDTPADALFARVERDYSHGCVRIEKPFEMAQWVLQDRPEWTPEKIQAAMNSGKEHQVALKHHIPVYIVYETVWVDEDGTVEFRDDIYGHDARQERILPASPIPGAIQVAQEHPGREARATPESVRATF